MSNLGNKTDFAMYTVSIYEQNVSNKESSRYAVPSLLQAAKQQKRRKARDLTNLWGGAEQLRKLKENLLL